MTIQLPKFTLLEKLYASDAMACCSRCGREIKNSYLIRNNETGEVNNYGSGCAKKVMGISITEVVEQNKAYEEAVARAAREEEMEAMGRTFIEAFQEAEPEMLQFIAEGAEENSFLADMKKMIEEKGSLTDPQYQAVWRMMLPFADLEKGEKVDMVVYPLQLKIEEGMYGWSYTIVAATEDKKKVRIFFSSLNEQKEADLQWANVLEVDRYGNRYGRTTIAMDNPIRVKGTFDGYKIKRAKIETITEEVA